MNMKKWAADLLAADKKLPMPVLSFPSVTLLGIGVKELISDPELQAKGMKAVADRNRASASVSMMGLSVEAEAFGSVIRVSDDEVPTVIGAIASDEEEAKALKVPEIGAGRTGLYIKAIEKAAQLITDRPVLAGIIGMVYNDFSFLGFTQNIYSGFTGMIEIFLLSLMIGGLSEMCSHYGGILWMLNKIKGFVKGKKSAQIGISALVSLCDAATANNTIAIIIAGQPSKEICETYEVDPRKSASLLDIWSCVFQGLLPYSAQVLIACGLTAGLVSPTELLPLMWYQYALAAFTIIAMFVPFADGVIRKHPWNFKTWSTEKDK